MSISKKYAMSPTVVTESQIAGLAPIWLLFFLVYNRYFGCRFHQHHKHRLHTQ